jgi:hypothetical protein
MIFFVIKHQQIANSLANFFFTLTGAMGRKKKPTGFLIV